MDLKVIIQRKCRDKFAELDVAHAPRSVQSLAGFLENPVRMLV
jgi:hypothetical protein